MASLLSRRRLVQGAPWLLLASAASPEVTCADDDTAGFSPVSPPEDLMREHGVLNRVLLIYDAAIEKLDKSEPFDVGVIAHGADIVRSFIEGYHERNEEQRLFPRFRRAGVMTDLVDVLYQQHQAGRRLTDNILSLVLNNGRADEVRAKLISNLRGFIALYRPHEAREDTELFPKLRQIVSPHEFDAMAEEFEREERRHFGEDGFEAVVSRLGPLEKVLGIYDLRRLMPG
jgi:hemerythrin-like domain-containing protein